MNCFTMMHRPLFRPKRKNNQLFLIILLGLLAVSPARAQHLIGLRSGYNVSGINFQRYDEPKSVTTYTNFSLLYTYYHPLWEVLDFFGLQTGISYTEQGFSMPNDYNEDLYDITRYQVFTIPVTSQFHIDFWRMRLLLNIGAFGGYRFSANEALYNRTGELIKRDYIFDCYDTKPDFGFIGGGGLAFKVKPFEVQFECNYQYSLSMLYNPKKLSNTSYIYVYPKQLIFSVALFLQLSK